MLTLCPLNTTECALTVTIDNPLRAAVKEELTTLVVQGTVPCRQP